MASEFWFFSQLHRLGYTAYITLGNTKGIDITVQLKNELLTFDVKGKETFSNGTYQYLPDNITAKGHFFAFIGLEISKEKTTGIIQFNTEPACYMIEASNLSRIVHHWQSSNNTTAGFGFNQRILPILKTFDSNMKLHPREQKILDHFKKEKRISESDVNVLKDIILTLEDFESKYHKQK